MRLVKISWLTLAILLSASSTICAKSVFQAVAERYEKQKADSLKKIESPDSLAKPKTKSLYATPEKLPEENPQIEEPDMSIPEPPGSDGSDSNANREILRLDNRDQTVVARDFHILRFGSMNNEGDIQNFSGRLALGIELFGWFHLRFLSVNVLKDYDDKIRASLNILSTLGAGTMFWLGSNISSDSKVATWLAGLTLLTFEGFELTPALGTKYVRAILGYHSDIYWHKDWWRGEGYGGLRFDFNHFAVDAYAAYPLWGVADKNQEVKFGASLAFSIFGNSVEQPKEPVAQQQTYEEIDLNDF